MNGGSVRIERFLIRSGLPQLVPGWTARTHVVPRMLPSLAFFAAFVTVVITRDGIFAEISPFAAGSAAGVAVWVLCGKLRAHVWELPRWVVLGITVLFLALPWTVILLHYAADRGAWVATGNEAGGIPAGLAAFLVGILITATAVVWLVVSYAGVQFGVVALVRVAFMQSLGDLRNSVRLHGRALPAMLFVTFLGFFAGEMWQLGAHLTWLRTVLILCLFALVATAAGASHLRDELDALEDVNLTKRQMRNVLTVLATRQLVQATVVGVAIFAFFAVLGVVAVDPQTAETWVGAKPDASVIPGVPQALLRCAALLAGFGATNFVVSTMTDRDARSEFFRPIVSDLEESLRRWAEATRPAPEPVPA
ncbi:hypothetical protein DB35_15075 [Streptomyces abyssalis]|nr:hypothetical protein DB35_15075 [Streptomyces abyssalis]